MDPRLSRAVPAKRHRVLAEKVELHASGLGREVIERIQTDRFNAIWSYCLREVPFYQAWRDEHGLPSRISHPTDLEGFPELDKATIVAREKEIFGSGSTRHCYSTGGSTASPTHFPAGRVDGPYYWANSYIGRSWWGIRPYDSNLHLWSHAHLFGSGLTRYVRQYKRVAMDRLVNRVRLDGYDQREAALHRDYETLLEVRPVYVSGNTSTMFKLARYIETHDLPVKHLGLKGVLVTAETVSDADVEGIERAFGAPVLIEYGAAETGVIALSAAPTTRPLRVIWDSFIALVDCEQELRVTTLDPRRFPLVNYRIGDRAVTDSTNALDFHAVLGRTQDFLRVPAKDGTVTEFLAIVPIHILKTYPGVLAVQFAQLDRGVRVFVQSAAPTTDLCDLKAFVLGKLLAEYPELDPEAISFELMDEPQRTIAGKHTLFRA